MPTAGGIHLAFDRLKEVEGEAMQVFTKNHRQWKDNHLSAESIELFRTKWEKTGRIPVAAHDAYLINLAAPDDSIATRSVAGFAGELRRCAQLGIQYLVMHPGAHVGDGAESGLRRLVANLDRAMDASETESVMVLIENTAGQGSSLGSSFEQIRFILETSSHGNLMGVCFDTCHGFSAGFDITAEESYRKTMEDFDRVIGLERLKFFHLNDSKKAFESRVDRHEHIGKGTIGLEGFRLLLNDPRFREHPMVLETPKGKDLKEDKLNLRVLRSLLGRSTPVDADEEILSLWNTLTEKIPAPAASQPGREQRKALVKD